MNQKSIHCWSPITAAYSKVRGGAQHSAHGLSSWPHPSPAPLGTAAHMRPKQSVWHRRHQPLPLLAVMFSAFQRENLTSNPNLFPSKQLEVRIRTTSKIPMLPSFVNNNFTEIKTHFFYFPSWPQDGSNRQKYVKLLFSSSFLFLLAQQHRGTATAEAEQLELLEK